MKDRGEGENGEGVVELWKSKWSLEVGRYESVTNWGEEEGGSAERDERGGGEVRVEKTRKVGVRALVCGLEVRLLFVVNMEKVLVSIRVTGHDSMSLI